MALGTVALLSTACSFEFKLGGEAVATSFDVEDFTEIEVGNTFEADIVVGDTTSVEVEIAEQLQDKLDVRVDGDRLHIGVDGGLVSSSSDMKVTITTPELIALATDGATDVQITDIDATDFDLQVGGASSVNADGAIANLTLIVDGASEVDLDGVAVEVADVTIDGASDVNLNDVSTVTGSVDGASNLDVPDGETFDVDVSGGATID